VGTALRGVALASTKTGVPSAVNASGATDALPIICPAVLLTSTGS
jgi:hypothetical protein